MSVHFSPSFRICAPLAGPGAYCSRLVTFVSSSSFSFVPPALVWIAPCGPDNIREHPREPTRTGGTEPATHPPLGVASAAGGSAAARAAAVGDLLLRSCSTSPYQRISCVS